MTVKRSRMARSSSFICDTRVFTPPSPPLPGMQCDRPAILMPIISPKVSEGSVQYRPTILTVSSPEVVNEKEEDKKGSGQGHIGYFLDQCHFCKNKFREKDDFFMYGYLGAFCTPKCRNKQMALDKIADLIEVLQSRVERTHCSRMNDVKDQSGSELEKHATPMFYI